MYSCFLLFGVEIKNTGKTKFADHIVTETKVPVHVLVIRYQEQTLVTTQRQFHQSPSFKPEFQDAYAGYSAIYFVIHHVFTLEFIMHFFFLHPSCLSGLSASLSFVKDSLKRLNYDVNDHKLLTR